MARKSKKGDFVNVLHNNTVNHPVPHIPHHRLKPWTLKIRTRAGDIRKRCGG